MRLTDHTDYSLRVLMYLNQQRTLITLNELSENLGISRNNLIKVSNQLAKLDLIMTTRGRTGGLMIKEETGKKNLKEIVSKTEESFNMAECFVGKSCDCSFLPNCSLKKSLSSALYAFFDSLAGQTLNDVTPKRNLKVS